MQASAKSPFLVLLKRRPIHPSKPEKTQDIYPYPYTKTSSNTENENTNQQREQQQSATDQTTKDDKQQPINGTPQTNKPTLTTTNHQQHSRPTDQRPRTQ
jgi:hypothetical protein